jgi:hypothetical protein
MTDVSCSALKRNAKMFHYIALPIKLWHCTTSSTLFFNDMLSGRDIVFLKKLELIESISHFHAVFI